MNDRKDPAPATITELLGLDADAEPTFVEVYDLGDSPTAEAFARLSAALRAEDDAAVDAAMADIHDRASVMPMAQKKTPGHPRRSSPAWPRRARTGA